MYESIRQQLLAHAILNAGPEDSGRESVLIRAMDILALDPQDPAYLDLGRLAATLNEVVSAMSLGEDNSAIRDAESAVLDHALRVLRLRVLRVAMVGTQRLGTAISFNERLASSNTWTAVHCANLNVTAFIATSYNLRPNLGKVPVVGFFAARSDLLSRISALKAARNRQAEALGVLAASSGTPSLDLINDITGVLVGMPNLGMKLFSQSKEGKEITSAANALSIATPAQSSAPSVRMRKPSISSVRGSSDMRSRYELALSVVETVKTLPATLEILPATYGAAPVLQQYWLPSLVAVVAVGITKSAIKANAASLTQIAKNAFETVTILAQDYILLPLRQMYATVRHRERRLALLGSESVASDLDSLERMVVAFARDHGITDDSRIRGQVANGDLSVVMTRYEDDIKSPLAASLRGDLIRSVLIQVHKSKVDLELAMSALDKLLQANELNFAILSVVPVVAFALAIMQQTRAFLRRRGGVAREIAYDGIRLCLGDVERLLNRANRGTAVAKVEEVVPGGYEGHVHGLSYVDYGLLLTELETLKQLVSRVPRKYRIRFEEDLRELSDPQWTVYQRCETVKRMGRWYPFVQQKE
ncbi:Nuclear control of ATPase protein 2 [Entophlyctis luteolus]|nr:Nuclear control of ATPase protein 2 [Entophlyctis luteolus]